MLYLKNEVMEVAVNPLGAELSSVKTGGREWIWDGDESVWEGRAPILFPICGSVKDNVYRFEGESYTLPKHGFARHALFEVVSHNDTALTLQLTDSEETHRQYPFAFRLQVSFTVTGNRLSVRYAVTNRDTRTMYYSIGAHEAYDCRPDGIEAYDVEFAEPETFDSTVLCGEELSNETISLAPAGRVLPLKKEYFSVDAQVFKELCSRSVVLRHRPTGHALRLEFPDMDYFLLWTKPQGLYICLEPWSGIPDSLDSDGDLTHKEGINPLEPGATRTHDHAITFGIG